MGTPGLICNTCNTLLPHERAGDECPMSKCSGTVVDTLEGTFAARTHAKMTLPATTAARKAIPLASGCLDYFPAALAAVAALSKAGNDKHNPGQDLHWARGKSMDHADCILRHLVDRGTVDPEDGISHSAKVAWRALALLQEELEAAGSPLARAARVA